MYKKYSNRMEVILCGIRMSTPVAGSSLYKQSSVEATEMQGLQKTTTINRLHA